MGVFMTLTACPCAPYSVSYSTFFKRHTEGRKDGSQDGSHQPAETGLLLCASRVRIWFVPWRRFEYIFRIRSTSLWQPAGEVDHGGELFDTLRAEHVRQRAKTLWALGETGRAFEHVPLGGTYGGLDHPHFVAMNLHRRVPTLKDGDVVVWESDAIIRYVAAKYSSDTLWPEDVAERSRGCLLPGARRAPAGSRVRSRWSSNHRGYSGRRDTVPLLQSAHRERILPQPRAVVRAARREGAVPQLRDSFFRGASRPSGVLAVAARRIVRIVPGGVCVARPDIDDTELRAQLFAVGRQDW